MPFRLMLLRRLPKLIFRSVPIACGQITSTKMRVKDHIFT